jgi:hypothetical protein|tara:strand:+ start:1206 stop:1643 length:438 start_codon:yes stop_codon:yes gene_type:complete
MKPKKFLIITAVFVTENKSDLDPKLRNLPGKWDLINTDGSLSIVDNPSEKKDEDIIKLAYIKPLKQNNLDNRTYKQVDSMEAYIKYFILRNPDMYICDVSFFYEDLKTGFNINNLVDEMGINKRSIMLFCDLETTIPDYEEIRRS